MKNIFIFFTFSIVLIGFSTTHAQWCWQNPLPQGNTLSEVSFTDPRNGIAVGSRGTIISTTDGGTSWTIQSSTTENNLMCVWLTDEFKGTVVGYGGIILHTSDGGNEWMHQFSGTTTNLSKVYFIGDSIGTIVGNSGTILRTTNEGSTWNPQNSGTSNSLYDVAFFNQNIGIAVGYGSLLRTSDGGTTWNVGYDVGEESTVYRIAVSPDGMTAVAAGWDVDENYLTWRTTDRGLSWNPISISYQPSDLYFANDTLAIMTGYPGTYVLKTTNGGASWFLVSTGLPGMGVSFGAVSFSDGENGTAVGELGYILRTTNGGNSWFLQSIGEVTSQNRDVHFFNNNNGLVIGIMMAENGVENGIFRTTNGGQTWVRNCTPPPNLSPYDMDFCDMNTGYVIGGYGLILRTTDAGLTWTYQSGLGTMSMLSVACANENIAYITGFQGRIYKTTDAGANWAPQVSGTNSNLWSVQFFGPDTGIAVGTGGVIVKTVDGGATWQALTSGITTGLYAVYFVNPDLGWAVGDGGKILKTTNGGVNWSIQPSGVTTQLLAVHFLDENTGSIGGVTGTLLNTTDGGATWISEPTLNGRTLWEVFYSDINHVWAVGDFGSIFCKNTAPTTFPLTVNITEGWNIVSIPGLHPVDQNVNTWWPGKDPAAGVFKFAGGYQAVTTAEPGNGYWMKHLGAQTYNTGEEWPAAGFNFVSHDPLAGISGWNLIGAYDESVPVSGLTTTPPGLINGPVYKYSTGYQPAVSLDPGYGYWVKLNEAGQINIPSGTARSLKGTGISTEGFGRIIITDKTSRSYTLYAADDGADLTQFELPPLPPQGMFDIRYSTQRFVEKLTGTPVGIDITGLYWPLKVKAEAVGLIISDDNGKEIARIKPGEEVILSSQVNKLFVSGDLIPAVYSLEQNYPNPFNPNTTIQFSIPENVQNIKLLIYNALGEKVAQLVNSSLPAGTYKYTWNAADISSGMYIYQVITEKFVSTRKMILLK